MNIKKKIAVLLVLTGIAIPVVLLFFQSDGYILRLRYSRYEDSLKDKEIQAVLYLARAWNSLKSLNDIVQKATISPPAGYELEDMIDANKNIADYFSLIGVTVYDKQIVFPDGEKLSLLRKDIDLWWLHPPGYKRKNPLVVEIGIPYRYAVGLGVLVLIIGLGFFAFSLFQKDLIDKPGKSSAP